MTTIAGSTDFENIKTWAKWIEESVDQQLLTEVLQLFKPVRNIGHLEGLAKNN